jgi:hypothetical protein
MFKFGFSYKTRLIPKRCNVIEKYFLLPFYTKAQALPFLFLY